MPNGSLQIKLHDRVALLLAFVCVFAFSVTAQNELWETVKYKFAAPVESNVMDSLTVERSSWEEIASKRTEHSSTYKTPDGRIIARSGKVRLNYRDASGTLKPIDATLYPSANGWEAKQQQYPTYLYNNGSSAITLGNGKQLLFNQNSKVNGQFISTANAEFKGEGMHWKSVAAGMDKMVFFRQNLIETDYVLHQPMRTNAPYLVISEEVVLPQGYQLKTDLQRGTSENGLWKGDLVATNPKGNIEARFRVPVFIDANGKRTVGYYKLTENSNHTLLETYVPTNWLNHKDRKYPVIIDPLVTGLTASFGANTIPSCLDPNEGVDSIFVTVPAQITVTGVYVQSSYYADPLAGAVMGEGSMRFSTYCGTSTPLTVAAAQANQAGTAFLDFTNYRNTVGCCLVPMCTQQDFWLRMHIKRTAGGPGCNDTYIYYAPTTTSWPFECYVEGRTIETVINQWSVSPTQLCSDQCELTLDYTARYGVPPYTFSHPWASGTYSFGTPNPCSIHTAFEDTTVTIPNCPTYCGNTTNLTVPAPTITDACGNTISGWNTIDITVDPTPEITATPTSVEVCSGEPVDIQFTSCDGTSVDWTASDGTNGSDAVISTPLNVGTTADTITYTATVTGASGCVAAPVSVDVVVNPFPVADAGNNVTIGYGESTVLTGSGGATYSWTPSGTLDADDIANPTASPLETTTYTLTVSNNGCVSTDEVTVNVEQIIEIPNTITPNGDGVNDTWEIINLHRYPECRLTVYTRWGQKVFNTIGYTENWDGTNGGKFLPASTYYYTLDLGRPGIPKEHRLLAGSITIIY